ncbi:polyphosphate kinase 1 [Nitrospira sp. KM1]|uniref:polyphosphate kinase 1 n=1 Tax=Nitrospira sp. KM1 TaxID=1936990 RepID=UPI0013A72AB1|nr:polyphosphate kinase 1 [Nitrospira sp. KM1]BCA52890.1 polyphosphate kinase 1 [Nitrospira sp. KM1]
MSISPNPNLDSGLPSNETVQNLDSPNLFLNRELSWLQFNLRVLEEAENTGYPLLERAKFLTIFATNLDEFFMTRVSALRRQVAAGVGEPPPDGMTPSEQMLAICREVTPLLQRHQSCWHEDICPKLSETGIHVLHSKSLTEKERLRLRDYFCAEIFPVLTPLAIDPTHPFPHVSNLSFNLAVIVKDPDRGECFARVKLPGGFKRLIPIPEESPASLQETLLGSESRISRFVWLEDIVADNLDLLFPGVEIVASYAFRVTRDADLTITENEAADLLTTVEQQLDLREFGSAVRLELEAKTPSSIADILIGNLQLSPYLVYSENDPIGMAGIAELTALDRPDLKDPFHVPVVPPICTQPGGMLAAVRQQDILLFHPYDSFVPVVDFIREAANDSAVLAIKQTLYRVGAKSPIVDALLEARMNGKQVAVLVELKARFDEESNIEWARKLEDEGVHVVYGVHGLKTHAKTCLVVRRESEGIRRYAHLATGNYNVATSRIYTDLSYFTSDPVICNDVSDLFNALTGYSRKPAYDKLLIAPKLLRKELIDRIEREITHHQAGRDGYIAFKMNALVDKACIQALYRASQAGVKIDLQVRGICCLRPGVPGLSETIRVVSVVGRFLEHARIYYFKNGGQDEVFAGSADLMPRNLDQRVEILFPVTPPHWRDVLITEILGIGIQDNVQARELQPDGTYRRLHPSEGESPIHSQEWFMSRWKSRY